ncbi:MAG: hypothetical protein V4708_16960 [Bacteroidota bacterium]
MSFYYPPFQQSLEPSEGNVRGWLDNLYSKFQPIEQSRWNQSNIDSLFYAGAQEYVNQYFGLSRTANNKFYFNLLQQPVNMITGYQRQHRKGISFVPCEGADTQTTDQFTKLSTQVCNKEGIHEQYSRACEQACITGMVLLQPYLDYTGDDPAQGQFKLKLWEYNSFLMDPYFRSPDGSDAQFFWTQEYISKKEAEFRFPDKYSTVAPMSGTPQRYGSFYFLPENYNMARNDLMVLSYVWYKWKTKRKKLYSKSKNQFFDFTGGQEQLDAILYGIDDMEEVEVETPTWKLAVVLNDQLMFQGENPLGFDDCPFIPVFWNYEPHINYFDLRCRGLVRTMRDSNYLLNRRIILNHDISEATINNGWKRKQGAVANEDNLKKVGQGWDIIINEGYELMDCEKILPTAVPQSDMALADQLQSLIFSVSGVNLESWSAQDQANASSLTVMLKQAANLMVLQKYFDQWDYSLKLIGTRFMQIVQSNWSAEKIKLMIGEDPSPFFYSKMFAKYNVVVEEGILTATQRYQEYQGLLELNQQIGGIIPASYIASKAPIQGKQELMKVLDQQQQQQSEIQAQAGHIAHALEEAKLRKMESESVSNMATAVERHGRNQSNVGLYEERLSMITKNRASAKKEEMEALEKLMDVIARYGEIETHLKSQEIDTLDWQQKEGEEQEKMDAQRTSEGNNFAREIMGMSMRQDASQKMNPMSQQQGMNPGQQEEQMI